MQRMIDDQGADLPLLSIQALAAPDFDGSVPYASAATYRLVQGWIKSYLSSTHRDLGRSGMVCPFTAHAARIDTIRIGVSLLDSTDASRIEAEIRRAFRAFSAIPCAKSMRHFRTIIIGFPNLDTADGIACLHAVQTRTKLFTLLRGLMTAVFHAKNDAPGLWNPDFRPLRAPIPLFAIRMLVENDAPFIMGHPLMMPTYLWKFPVAGARRMLEHLGKKA